jgi:hypothetical protein
LRSDEQNTEMEGDVTGDTCPGRDAAFFTLLRRTGTAQSAVLLTAPAQRCTTPIARRRRA